MVRHIILWQLKDELTASERQVVKLGIKHGLEGLKGVVPGLLDIKVQIDGRLETSNADVMLDCTLESADALAVYAQHPAHVRVANERVRPFTSTRTCLDFEF